MEFPESDQNLVRRVQTGDNEAFNELVLRHTPALFRVVRRMASDSAEAEAIVQEAFLRTWRALRAWRVHPDPTDRSFFSYLVTIALNIGRDQWRKERFLDFRGLEPLDEVLFDPEPVPEIQLEQAQTVEALAKAVAELPPAYRAVVALRYDGELSYQEIAGVLGLPVNTVRTHLRRAKAHLKRMMEEQEDPIERS